MQILIMLVDEERQNTQEWENCDMQRVESMYVHLLGEIFIFTTRKRCN